MRVTCLKTGEIVNYTDEYAERLIEQGKAVIVGDEKPGVKKAEEAPKAEEQPANSGKKK